VRSYQIRKIVATTWIKDREKIRELGADVEKNREPRVIMAYTDLYNLGGVGFWIQKS